jgi:hypothetical protein
MGGDSTRPLDRRTVLAGLATGAAGSLAGCSVLEGGDDADVSTVEDDRAREPAHRFALLALYQLSIVIGIILLPLAIVAQVGGITLPIHRVVDRLGRAYRNARDATP